jgi:NitT/TauT family transport system permease protein
MKNFATLILLPKPIKNLISKLGLFVFTLVIWYLIAWLINAKYILPYPHRVFFLIGSEPLSFLKDALITILEAFGGLVIGSIGALFLAFTIYFFPKAERFIMPYAIGIKATPIIAIAPLLTLWFGYGYGTKVIMAALISFFPMLQGMTDALKSVPNKVLSYSKVLGTSRFRELIHFRLYYSVPLVASSLKIAAPLSVVGAIVSEYVGADAGLGHLLFAQFSKSNITFVFSIVIFAVVIGLFFYSLTFLLEKWCLRLLKMEREEYK